MQAAPRVHGRTTLPPGDEIYQSVKEHNRTDNGAQERARQDKILQKLSCRITHAQHSCRLHATIAHEKEDAPFNRKKAYEARERQNTDTHASTIRGDSRGEFLAPSSGLCKKGISCLLAPATGENQNNECPICHGKCVFEFKEEWIARGIFGSVERGMVGSSMRPMAASGTKAATRTATQTVVVQET